MRWGAAPGIALLVVLAVTACTLVERDATAAELETFAEIGANAADAGVREFSVEIPRVRGNQLVDGWIDLGDRVGYAAIVGENSVSGLVVFDEVTIAARIGDPGNPPPLPPPVDAWEQWTLSRDADALEFVIASLLAIDRVGAPTGVRSLGDADIDGTKVSGFSAPIDGFNDAGQGSDAPARYWIDADGRLVRVELPLGSAIAVVDFGRSADIELPTVAALAVDR